jgi:hypothetical protein
MPGIWGSFKDFHGDDRSFIFSTTLKNFNNFAQENHDYGGHFNGVYMVFFAVVLDNC